MDFTLNMPQEWKVTPDGGGLHAVCGMLEASVDYGVMPEESTAQDQAFTNYLDMVGFDQDDPEDFNPIGVCNFNNRKAYGFQVWVDDDRQICVLCLEPKKGKLAVVSAIGPDPQVVLQIVERGLRFK